ncbi:transglutaminase domain-containing protein [Streptomyces phaeochromogenes]|uniref:transglutaminase domain-containing protein n=1 Tax=Streptomyces phaeochromogenes TaxID=1923 RepID=UPI002E0D387C|nr:transglutaminase-like domain-containing protein [Streptomyces phaeochromogenes]
MTSRLLMPYRSAGRAARSDVRRVTRPPEVRGSTRATEILDWTDPGVTALVNRVRGRASASETLRVAHGIIAREIRPVYSVEDRRRVSTTLRLGRGSCSQRMAVLEAVARAVGIRTRVRGLLVDGVFWYPRFPRLKPLVPKQVLLAWPEFRLEGAWVPIGELFGKAGGDGAFTNRGGETLFDAVARTTVDWGGATACGATGGGCDLSAQVRTDLGHFDSRDALFAQQGQTLCFAARTVTEPVLGRWSAGA